MQTDIGTNIDNQNENENENETEGFENFKKCC